MTNVNIARHGMHACLKVYIYRHLSVIYIILNHYFYTNRKISIYQIYSFCLIFITLKIEIKNFHN